MENPSTRTKIQGAGQVKVGRGNLTRGGNNKWQGVGLSCNHLTIVVGLWVCVTVPDNGKLQSTTTEGTTEATASYFTWAVDG